MRNIFLVLMLGFCSVALAQIPTTPKAVLSPNAANLGLYGEIPVSHFTGTPSIEIPLYELKTEYLNLPISLSYHASGVRPDQRPGWVGMGWSLNAGGLISRIVNDMPDEFNNPHYGSSGKEAGYYFQYSVLNSTEWNQRTRLRQVAQDIDKVIKDTAPDEFYFNFGGYQGKFLLNHKRQWVVQCDRPIQVVFDDTYLEVPFSKQGTLAEKYGYSPSFSGFTLITEDGTQYIFGGKVDAIDYSIDFFMQYEDEWIATSWYLTKIVIPNGEEITFSYERGDFTNQMMLAVYHDLESYVEKSGGFWSPEPSCSSWSTTSIASSYQGKLISPAYLSTISYMDIRISFVRSLAADMQYDQSVYRHKYQEWLDSSAPLNRHWFLPILSSENTLTDDYPDCLNKLKSYKLTAMRVTAPKTMYTSSRSTLRDISFSYKESDKLRLMLEEVRDSELVYKLEYNKPELLPGYLSNMVDHWGFYNGKQAYLNYSQYYSYREPDAEKLQYGILNKIIYPTTGYTRFEFEPHEYGKQLSLKRWESCEELSQAKMAGGLRIKRIINNSDSVNETVAKEFFYVTDFLDNRENARRSSGILGGQIKYYFTDYIVRAFNAKDVRRKMSVFSSQSVLPGCENTTGCHIGYTEVIEKRADNSFIRYHYTNFDNGHMDEPADAIIQETHTPYEPYVSKALERGHLILQESYAADGKKKKSRTITYAKSSKSDVRLVKAVYTPVCPETSICYDEGAAYRIYMYHYRVLKEEEVYYDDVGSPFITSTTYTYNKNDLLRSLTKTANGGVKVVTYKRIDEFNETVYSMMKAQHVLSPVVETEETFIPDNGQAKLIKQVRFDYVPCSLASASCFPLSTIKEKTGSAPLREVYTCHEHNMKGNPVYVTQHDGLDVVYMWNGSGRYLIAKITNVTLSDFREALLTAVGANEFIWANQLRAKLPSAHITTYQYKPGVGVVTVIEPNENEKRFEYNSRGNLETEMDGKDNILKTYYYFYAGSGMKHIPGNPDLPWGH